MRLKGYIGLGLVCLFYWILDSIWSYFSFEHNLRTLMYAEPGSYLDTFLLKVPPYQIVSRLMVVTLFIILGSIILEFFIKRQAAERERKTAHDTLLTVLNSIDATIYVADIKSHEILFMNQHMIDSFGEDFSGKICYEVFRQNTQPCDFCTNDLLLDESGNPKGVVTWENRNPITNAWYANYDRAIVWIDGRLVRLQIATDITPLKEAQEKQLKAEAQLRQAQKMEAVGTLAGGIAHDFNNLLQAINGYTQILLFDKTKSHPDYPHLHAVLTAGDRAAQLVRQLLLFSRKVEAERKPIDLNLEIEQALRILERTIPKMIEIEIHPGRGLWTIHADPVQIEQVLLNLGSNAADSMPDGGRLIVETENITLNENYGVTHLGAEPGDYVLLSVSDTGHGMDKETVDHIFEPFFTTKDIGKGTGLGLASVYGIVKSHSGYVTCYSEVNGGTRFRIFLPAEGRPRDEVEDMGGKLPDGGGETILIVDDEESIRDFVSKVLDKYGYAVTTAISGEEALQIYSQKPNGIDLVLLDIGMPGMGGHKCLEELIGMDPSVRIIVASGYLKDGKVQQTLESGAAGFIGKPYEISDLLDKVRSVLDGTK